MSREKDDSKDEGSNPVLLSDMGIELPTSDAGLITRLVLKVPSSVTQCSEQAPEQKAPPGRSDGEYSSSADGNGNNRDSSPPRRRNKRRRRQHEELKKDLETRMLTLSHDAETPLSLVGRQLWRGALLLADFAVRWVWLCRILKCCK